MKKSEYYVICNGRFAMEMKTGKNKFKRKGMCLLTESSIAAEIIAGEKYTRLKKRINSSAMAVAVEIEGLLSLGIRSLTIEIKST